MGTATNEREVRLQTRSKLRGGACGSGYLAAGGAAMCGQRALRRKGKRGGSRQAMRRCTLTTWQERQGSVHTRRHSDRHSVCGIVARATIAVSRCRGHNTCAGRGSGVVVC